MTRTSLLILSLLIFQLFASGQRIGFETIDDSKVSPWMPKFMIEFQYVYHFGDSEIESELLLQFGIDKDYAQIKTASWSKDAKSMIWNYENLTNVRIEGNKFYSDKTDGEFVIYDNGQEKIKGLKIYNSWSRLDENDEYEIGPKLYPISDYYKGDFSQASKRLLSKDELKKMSKADLKIMRNEIFARYGYEFKSGGEMDNYFQSQNWYFGQHDNVNNYLSELEKENIKLIQQIENE